MNLNPAELLNPVLSLSVSRPNRSRAGCQPRQHVFPKRRSSECGQPKCPACKRVKFDCAAPKWNVMFKAMMVGGESARRFDKCEDGGLDWRGKFCPSSDYLCQVRTRRD